jgi:protein associated with RNAse G/E
MTPITLYKLDHSGQEVMRYAGKLITGDTTWRCIEAAFSRDLERDYVHFRLNDRVVEWHYSDRWYNILELHDVDDDRLKGWYCNITRPAVLTETTIAADDLELDLFVYPNGDTLLLDEDEFAELELTSEEHAACLNAVEVLKDHIRQRLAPFDAIPVDTK